jgi:muramoyltetrapeptide carboxypeptidase
MTRGIGIIGLSGYESDATRLARATRYFEARDCHVRLLPQASASVERFAAPEQQRLAALATFLEASDIEIVIALRGGYGLSRLLDSIDFEAMTKRLARSQQKWIGHSDFTALNLALLARAGAVSYAGPMAGPDFGLDHLDDYTEAQFWRIVDGGPLDLEWRTSAPDQQASGTLWGGNLAMVTSLMGTRYFPDIDDGILYIEDTGEAPYRVERMLLQLDMAGVLARQKAVLVGEFDRIPTHEYNRGFDLARAFEYVSSRHGTRFVPGLPFGHGAKKATLPHGARANLSVVAGIARLKAA